MLGYPRGLRGEKSSAPPVRWQSTEAQLFTAN